MARGEIVKYRFCLTPAVRSISEWQLEHYREDKRQLEKIRNDAISIPIASGERTKTNALARPTETAAIRLSAPYILRMETGVAAVQRALDLSEPEDLKLIQLVYWEKRYNVDGAASVLYMGRATAYRRINEILGCVAFGLGYIKDTDIRKFKGE